MFKTKKLKLNQRKYSKINQISLKNFENILFILQQKMQMGGVKEAFNKQQKEKKR